MSRHINWMPVTAEAASDAAVDVLRFAHDRLQRQRALVDGSDPGDVIVMTVPQGSLHEISHMLSVTFGFDPGLRGQFGDQSRTDPKELGATDDA